MRALYRLTARKVTTLAKPGRYADGGNLYLQIGNGGKSWIFRYRQRGTGRVREMGLGPVQTISLQEARQRAASAHSLIASDLDPLADRRSRRAVASNARTFGDYTEEFLKSALTGFKNEKHKAQWGATLKTYAKPLWPMLLPEITSEAVRQVLDPIWDAKPETARRVRGRIERVLSAAKADGLRDGENPARWKDNLQAHFESRKKPANKHHSAIPFEDMPAFMRDLRKLASTSARALEFAILTAARSGEVRGMRWFEINFTDKTWTVPAERMKMKKEHIVPLTDRAIEILRGLKHGKPGDLVFKGAKPGEPLSDAALLMCLRGIRPGFTTHGFRSSFSDWRGDKTDFPRELAEFALAHKIEDKAEAAYRRKTAIERRREMMAAWQAYLAG